MKFITSTFITYVLISHKIAIIRATNYNTPKLNVKNQFKPVKSNTISLIMIIR